MNDDLIDFLIDTDSIDEFLGNKPKCPNCGSQMVEIIYGMPNSKTKEKAQKKELFLGGCIIGDKNPKYHCNKCRRSYFDDLKNYIKEENNWE